MGRSSSFLLSFFCALLLWVPTSHAKTSPALQALEETIQANPKDAQEFFSYPSDIQQAMLEASLHPDTLRSLTENQAQTQRQFRALISGESRKVQEEIYNLVRYPTLLRNLVAEGKPSKSEIERLSAGYPEGVQRAALDLGRKHFKALEKIQGLYESSMQDFARRVDFLSPTSQQAFRKLVDVPEALTFLQENPQWTRRMAEAYGEAPEEVSQRLAVLGEEANRKNTEALGEYEEELKKDPEAYEEMKEATQVFAREHGYSLDEEAAPQNITNVYVNYPAYPYWFGYPIWWSYPIWRPYPYWFYTGFWYGPSFGFFWGWPSYYFTSWYFSPYYGYYNRYPYLSRYWVNYAHRNRHVHRGFHDGVNHWTHSRGRWDDKVIRSRTGTGVQNVRSPSGTVTNPTRSRIEGTSVRRGRDSGRIQSSESRSRGLHRGREIQAGREIQPSTQRFIRSRNSSLERTASPRGAAVGRNMERGVGRSMERSQMNSQLRQGGSSSMFHRSSSGRGGSFQPSMGGQHSFSPGRGHSGGGFRGGGFSGGGSRGGGFSGGGGGHGHGRSR